MADLKLFRNELTSQLIVQLGLTSNEAIPDWKLHRVLIHPKQLCTGVSLVNNSGVGRQIPSQVLVDNFIVEEANDHKILATEVVKFVCDIAGWCKNVGSPFHFMRPDAVQRYNKALRHHAQTGERFDMRFGYVTAIDVGRPLSNLENVPGVGVSARPQTTAGWQPYLHDHEY